MPYNFDLLWLLVCCPGQVPHLHDGDRQEESDSRIDLNSSSKHSYLRVVLELGFYERSSRPGRSFISATADPGDLARPYEEGREDGGEPRTYSYGLSEHLYPRALLAAG